MNRDGSTLFDGEREWARRLLSITKGCAPSMHEPDRNAQVVGESAHIGDGRVYLEGSFDNACGDGPDACGELTLGIVHDVDFDDEGSPTHTLIEHFNLATLVAFARLGARLFTDRNRDTLYGWADKAIEILRKSDPLSKGDRKVLADSLEIALAAAKHHDPVQR